MLITSQLVCAAWRVPRVALGCCRRVKSSSRIGSSGTTSPRLQSTSLFGTRVREGEARRSLLKMQKCRLLLETIAVGEPAAEPSASAGGEGYVFWADGFRLVASSSDGKSPWCVTRGRGWVGCGLRRFHSRELPSPVLLPLGTSSPCPCLPVCGLRCQSRSLLNPTGLFLLFGMACLVLLERQSHRPSPGFARSDAVDCLQRLLLSFWLEFSLTSFDY